VPCVLVSTIYLILFFFFIDFVSNFVVKFIIFYDTINNIYVIMLKRPKNKAKNQTQYSFYGDVFKWIKPVLAFFDVTSCSVPFWMPKSNLFRIVDGLWYTPTW